MSYSQIITLFSPQCHCRKTVVIKALIFPHEFCTAECHHLEAERIGLTEINPSRRPGTPVRPLARPYNSEAVEHPHCEAWNAAIDYLTAIAHMGPCDTPEYGQVAIAKIRHAATCYRVTLAQGEKETAEENITIVIHALRAVLATLDLFVKTSFPHMTEWASDMPLTWAEYLAYLEGAVDLYAGITRWILVATRELAGLVDGSFFIKGELSGYLDKIPPVTRQICRAISQVRSHTNSDLANHRDLAAAIDDWVDVARCLDSHVNHRRAFCRY
ncbi:hypothetical protein IWQ60_007658 [Tieghemiomyces parasiticus]|uniref:Uncharacterized protein n=1 Tax=Tieghemiomyces parasiticus TaxID=78921 RepID=A0A9W8DTB8_9FUNG|nr:hypothetical protein IWQ60_007658 [Tieghemiomyces parasiticus]